MLNRVAPDYPNLTRDELRDMFHATYDRLAAREKAETYSLSEKVWMATITLGANATGKDIEEFIATQFCERVEKEQG